MVSRILFFVNVRFGIACFLVEYVGVKYEEVVILMISNRSVEMQLAGF